ncbi:MAG: radical SAM protein [Opitutaceae bacterium]
MIVVWRITQRCNLRCPFCAYDRTIHRVRRDADKALVLQFGELLSAFQHETGQSVLVSWIGGEPFLWPALQEITRRFVVDFGLKVSTTTNGTSLGSEAMRRHVGDFYSEITLSVDRLGEGHDELRGWKGGYAALQRHIPQIAHEKLRTGRGPLLRVNTVIMHDNVGEFAALCGELANWGVDEISFNQLGGRDRPEFFPIHRLTPTDVAQLGDLIPDLRQRLAARGVRLLGGADYLHRFKASAANVALPIPNCHPGERFLFVDELGRVAPCNYAVNELGVPLGEIAAAADLILLKERFAAAIHQTQPTACGDCHATQVWTKFTS